MNPLIDQYLTEVSQTKAKKTAVDYRMRLERFDRYLTEIQALEITRETCINFVVSLKGVLGAASVHYHEQCLKAFLSWGVRCGAISQNWLQGRQISPYRSIKRPESFAFTAKEYRALLACSKGEWQGMITVAWNTGMRLGDLANLRWSEVGLEDRKISISPRKTRRFSKALEIPILPEALDWLAKANNLASDFVFPRLQAQYDNDYNTLCKAFKAICVQAKIKDKSFHGLRHSFVTRALCKGVQIGILSEITGQSIAVIQRYLHPTIEDKARALEVLI